MTDHVFIEDVTKAPIKLLDSFRKFAESLDFDFALNWNEDKTEVYMVCVGDTK